MRLLLVEDDNMLGSTLKKGLEFNGYSVEWFQSGQEAIDASLSGEFDLGVFDVNLPDMTGLDVLKEIRNRKDTKKLPVLMLTVNDGASKKVAALDLGADDYMTKPFDLDELMARLRALLRRKDGHTDNVLKTKFFSLNMGSKTVTIHREEDTYTPTGKELQVLSLLAQRPGNIIGKERIEEVLYGWDGEVGSNTVEVLIYNLRKKLGKDSIVTVRGVGYMVPA